MLFGASRSIGRSLLRPSALQKLQCKTPLIGQPARHQLHTATASAVPSNLVTSITIGQGFEAASTLSRVTTTLINSALSSWIVFIKRTFQPSLLRKKRKCGYLKRSKSVGGRKILRRRQNKGRARLFGA